MNICLTVAAQSTYLICLYSLTSNLAWWSCAMRSQRWCIHNFERRCFFVADQMFWYNFRPHSIDISLFSDFWDLKFSLVFVQKIQLLFCNNISKPPVLSIFSHYVPLIIFLFQKILKTKQLGNKLPSHLTNNLKL